MKSKEIFLGTIKKCNDLANYEKYGEKRYVGDFRTGHIEIGHIHSYVDIVDESAILIKVNEEKYIWVNSLTTFVDEFLVNLGLPINTISTTPNSINQFFVDNETLTPYFESEVNKNINVKSLKKLSR